MNEFRLQTLGALRLHGPAGELLAGRRKELMVVAYLARKSPAAVSRAELATLFWGERGEQRARQSLRQALVKLNRALGEAIEVTPDEVRVVAGALRLDVADFEAALAADRPREAADHWQGDFLARTEDAGAERYREWLELERLRLVGLLSGALEQLTAEAEARGAWAEAASWAGRWADAGPYDEAAHLRLIGALRLADRAGEARARLDVFTARLHRELGVQPSPEWVRLAAEMDESVRVARVRSGPGSAALFSPDLVGRAAELAELHAAWRAVAAEGNSALVLVEGEEGIGKTRLCEEFLRTLDGTEALVLRVRGAGDGAKLGPWTGARELLAPLARAPGLGGASNADLAAAARLVPAIRERYPELPAHRSGDDRALGSALSRVLADVAAEVPVLLLLDDFPALDVATRTWLLTLARERPPSLMLLLTAAASESGALARAGLHDRPPTRRLKLQPLGAAETEALLASMLELPAPERHTLAARLHAGTGGNPFFLTETIAALVDERWIVLGSDGIWRAAAATEHDPLPLPASVREAIGERIARLSEPARCVLGVAAASAATDVAALETEAALPPEEFRAGLDELVGRRLLRSAVSRAGGYELVHEVVRRVARVQLPAAPISARPGAPRLRRASLMGLAALVLAVAAAAMLTRRSGPSGAGSSTTIAVFPFEVRGSEALAYLGEGMVDLLSVALDGAGELRGADPRAVLSAIRHGGTAATDPERARVLASRLGAGGYVLGSVVEAGGRLQISATLYGTDAGVQAQAHAEAAEEAQVFTMVDAIALQLLGDRLSKPREKVARVAARTTRSLPALKAYLAGERALRRADYPLAIDGFARAIDHDSLFALAHYRYGLASEWAARPESLRAAAARALRHADRLPRRERLFLAAYAAAIQGDAGEAEARLRTLLQDYPDYLDGWFALGELLFHTAPATGRPVAHARHPFERVLHLDPAHEESILHLIRIAAAEDRRTDVDALMARVGTLTSSGSGVGTVIQAVHAYSRTDPTGRNSVLAALSATPPEVIGVAMTHVALFARELEGARAIAGLLTESTRSHAERALGHTLRAELALARGRWREAEAELDRAARFSASRAVEVRAFLVGTPWLPIPPAEIEKLRRQVLSWDAAAEVGVFAGVPTWTYQPAVEPHLKPYLLGLLSVRLDSAAAVEGWVAALFGPDAPSPEIRELRHDLVWGLRARAVLAEGDAELALALLDRANFHVWYSWAVVSPFFARPHERFLRAELLDRAGRVEEALRAFAAFEAYSVHDLFYLAPSHLRRAQIYERLGRHREAAAHYARFLELWRECDPELRPLVERAEERLAALGRQ